jgi:hypothetical protein
LGFVWDGNTGTSGASSLAPGITVEISVVFDCSQTNSFVGTVAVVVIDSNGTASEARPVAGTIG